MNKVLCANLQNKDTLEGLNEALSNVTFDEIYRRKLKQNKHLNVESDRRHALEAKTDQALVKSCKADDAICW